MRRIADQRDSTSAPVTRRPSVVHVVAHHRGVARSRDQGGHEILPAAKPLQEVLFVALWPRLLARRFPGHGRPVDAVIRKVECQEFGATTDPVDSMPPIERQAVAVDNPAPDCRTQIEGFAIAQQLAAHDGAKAICPDE